MSYLKGYEHGGIVLGSGMKNASRIARVFEVVHVLSLSVWLGAVGLSGVVAGLIFPMMGKLQPTLGAYSAYEGDHALLTGGLVAGEVFLYVDTAQFICASIALGAFITMIVAGYQISTLTRALRCALLLLTMGLLSYHLFLLMPGMTDDLESYWELARIGETEQADRFKNAFMADHEKAANSLKGLMVGVFVSLVLSVWTGVGSGMGNAPADSSKGS
ncbi:MAG: hypothetical protein JJ974_03880 [Phycisphaerales bacterium]|nr:hypothetical protein [Phycisphaerales bacterium]